MGRSSVTLSEKIRATPILIKLSPYKSYKGLFIIYAILFGARIFSSKHGKSVQFMLSLSCGKLALISMSNYMGKSTSMMKD